MSPRTKFYIEPTLKDWAQKIVEAMKDYDLEGAGYLDDNTVRIWYRHKVTDKLECELLNYNKK